MWTRNTLKSLLVPGGLLLLAVAALAHSGWLTLALPALSFLRYCAVLGGMLLAWRFHSSRAFLALLVLALAEQAMAAAGPLYGSAMPGATVLEAVGLLVPVNLILIGLMHERGLNTASLAPAGLFLFVQAVVVAVLWRGAEMARPEPGLHRAAGPVALPAYVLAAFAAAGIILLLRFFLTRKIVDSALLWSMAAFFLALENISSQRLSMLYFATAACILAASIIENSYLLAYHDELTTLPSRRAFNDAMLRLEDPFSIAVVDIDHFKRFNDTYGHDTGDQVLRLVAANLARVSGGGQAYRCGGEEFMILFSGKTTPDVLDHLDQLRLAIETSEFRLRGGDRRQQARGPDRRNERARGRSRKGHAIRQLAEERPSLALSVTVSIGVASSTKENLHADVVLEAADKALYKAKANGRNRVESASAGRKGREQTAGIA